MGQTMKRKSKHAEGSLTTAGPKYARPRAKNVKEQVRRYDKRAQKIAAEREEKAE
jgi:hypothetical protein